MLLVVLLLPACGGPEDGSRAETLEDLAKRAFEALQKNDYSLFEPWVMTRADTDWVYERFRDGKSKPARRALERFEKEGYAVVDKTRAKMKRTFDKVRARAARDFDWAKAEYMGMGNATRLTVEGIPYAEFYFEVRGGEDVWHVRLDGCAKIDRGWVMGDEFKLGRKRR